ncbi:zinc finger and BTB domain-containing protein 38-like isoform X1 [Salmo trutta]|uniref:zinc finger and BTB domain-containing protein 38-like isoform X1 n=2 Tax=Salmo trutta TaxID=8032 RepID=UPI00113045F1|nr:zinc finger and BTB domain-containing protein 38-like isoform X1 [Salmo trutta]XP_029570756.1 zinc finger and BTB domain-containing protein 38-like isoform X1 [Salmo trutta]
MATMNQQMTVTSPCTQGLMDSSHPQALLSRLNEQRSQGLFCDVTIVVEDVKFRAHRNILAACSGYFRSAFTSTGVWTSSQVLELMDLRSEVFASILNLLYCSKVTSSPSTEDTRCLMAAGKRLGIPFLEKLVEQDRQDSGGPQIQTSTNPVKTTGHSKAQGPRKAKKETSRPEEPDSARGPRITNAFSITEVGPGNNLFTPLDLHRGERPSPDLGQTPAGCPAPCPLAVDNEPMQALSEHSYAVISQVPRDPEHRDGNQEDNKQGTKTTQSQPRQLASRNSGPLKKRHRLRAALSKSTPTPAVAHEPVHPTGSSPALIKPTVQPVGTSPPSLYPQTVHTSRANELPLAIDNGYRELDPPPLSPHTEDSISIYGCEHCPEIFTNKALLTVHTEMHKKRFVSHLFCKFCRRKFMHLKRLRNHETVCPKAQRGSPEHEPQGKEAGADHYSDSMPSTNNTVTNVQLSPELPDPFPPTSLQMNPTSKTLQAVDRLVKPSGGQRVYNCSVCKRAYVTVSSLKRHENVHSWQRAYPCHYCNKVFALAEYRTKHEIWHTGERRYQCIFCLETFMTYYILKNHQKAFHGIDPRLSVSKKSANGGFKGSVYPIKLYRLLPMKFRKRRYKTYSQTYSEELEGSEQAPLGCSSPIPPFDDGDAMSTQDAAIFSMPVTFMATPKVVASVMPRISFDQPCDQDVDQAAGTGKQASHSEHNGPPYSYTTPLAIMQAGVESPEMDYGDGAAFQRFKNPEGNSHNLPILKINPPSSLNRLCELSAAAQRIEAMTSQLFLPGVESLAPSKTAGGETETYIAKPACPGPSVDGHVLPLCQITVKIGNEAIIRRRIKGSKLFPRKRKRSSGSQVEERCWDQGRPTEGSMESSSLRFRTEVTSVIEPEPCDDLTDRDTADKLWRPYYSYKPKKKSKKLRSKHRKERRRLRYSMTSSVVPRASKDYLDKGCRSAEESISSEGTELKQRLRNTSPKTTYTCDICASTFITASGLRAHVIGCHPTFCRTCAKQCPPGEAPSASFETAEDSRDYICKSCMENGSCFDNCARSPSTEKRYHCSFCPQRFLYLATKKSHEKKHQETAGKGYSSDNYPTVPKRPATLDLGLNLKKHVIKTEEGEDQYSIDKESKVPAGLLGRFSTEKIEPKHEEWEDTGDYMSVAPEKEIPFRINSDGHYQKTPMSPPCTDTFSPIPSEMQYRKPSPSEMQYRKPSPSEMQYRKPSPSEMQYRKPSPSEMQYRKPSPSEMQYRKPKKRIEHKQQHQTSLTSKRQNQVDYIGRETPSHKAPMTTPGADSHFSYGQSSSTYLKRDSVTRATTPSSPKSEKHTYSAKKRPLYKHNTYHSGGKYF